MILDETHFEFGTFNSRDFGLMFAHIDTSAFAPIMGSVSSNTMFNKKNRSRYMISNNYEDYPLDIEVEIIKDDLHPIYKEERREVERRLFNSPNYQPLFFDILDDTYGDTYDLIDGYDYRYYAMCRFINPERIEDAAGLIIGYKCTMEWSSGQLTQETQSVTIAGNESGQTSEIIELMIDTDDIDYVYPRVTFKMASASSEDNATIVMYNVDDDAYTRQMQFNDIPYSVTIVTDGNTNMVSSSGDYNLYQNMYKRNFIRLKPGVNHLSLQCTGGLEYAKIEWNAHKNIM